MFGNLLNGVLIRKLERRFMWGLALKYGRCGIAEMMLSLTKTKLSTFYRLSTRLLIGSTNGPFFYQRRNELIWILGVPACKWCTGNLQPGVWLHTRRLRDA
jgi:hypothetical protein